MVLTVRGGELVSARPPGAVRALARTDLVLHAVDAADAKFRPSDPLEQVGFDELAAVTPPDLRAEPGKN